MPNETRANLTPYVPLAVRQWITSDDPDAKHKVIAGTTVFADVSGFTKLSERLNRIGMEGAEQITEVIGTAFSRLLEPAYSYDGMLLKFGGDALLLFYLGEGHEVRAASSALEMRRALRAMGTMDTPVGKVTLRMSQGVHSGDFHFFLAGNTYRELIMAGFDTTHVGVVEGEAGAGQIIVSDATARALPSRNLGTRKEHGHLLNGTLLPREPMTQTVYAVDQDLRPFIPTTLCEPITRDAVSSEHRPATAAFIRFSGVDDLLERDPETMTEAFDRLIDDVEAATAPRSIALLGADVYPDGIKVLLSGGAPVATGDDEENMLLALREIVDADRPLPLHVGVTRGPVFAGDVGTIFRRTYTIMGDRVNLAARLMSKAGPNQILTTEPVLTASRTLFDTEELPPFHVKGKAKPIRALAVGEPRGTRSDVSHGDAPLRGRNDELERIRSAWHRAVRGSGSLVAVDGARGLGKSRLLSEFAESVDDGTVYRTASRRYRETTPYFTSSLVLWEVLDIDRFDPEGAAARLREIVTDVDPGLLEYLSLIGTAIGLDLPETETERALAQEFRKPRLEQSVTALLSGFLTEPTAIWVDDAHHMDDASADLFSAWAAVAGDRPWLLAMSGQGVERAVAERELEALTIVLEPLADDDARAVVHAITEDAPLATHVTDEIVERAQGNPMFLLELVGTVGDGDVETLPDSIEAVVASRIDRLLPDDRRALRHLSVLGSGFRPEYASVVLPAGEARAAIPRLSEFIEVNDGWAKFRNGLIHRAAYSGLPYRRRRELHGNIAESIERAGGGPDILSVHFHAAGRWPEAWRYSREAGDHAREIYANLEAAALYERAIEASRWVDDVTTEDRAQVLECLGDVRDLAGLYEDAREAYRRVRGLVRGDPTSEARLALKESFMRELQGDLTQAVRWVRRGLRALDGVDTEESVSVRAELSLWYATLRGWQGRLEESLEWAQRSIEEASDAGNRRVLARAYLIRDYAEMNLGVSDGPTWTARALDIYEELGDLAGIGNASLNLGGYAYFAGDWAEACTYYDRARDAHDRTGNPVYAAMATGNIAEILLAQGHTRDLDARLRDAHRIFGASGDRWGIAFAERLLGIEASQRGKFDEADRFFESSRAGFTSLGIGDEVFSTDLSRAESLVMRGEAEAALAHLDELLDTSDTSSELADFFARLHRLRGEALLGLTRTDEARRELSAAEQLARDGGSDYELALVLTALAKVPDGDSTSVDSERVRERDAIVDRLGIVRPATVGA